MITLVVAGIMIDSYNYPGSQTTPANLTGADGAPPNWVVTAPRQIYV